MNPLLLRAIRASAGAVPPYLAGGAPMPVAVYNPMGAGSLAESYLRIAGTGGHANLDPAVVGSGVAPTHAPGTGWGCDGTKWLDTGIPLSDDLVILVRFSAATNNGQLIGATENSTNRIGISPFRTGVARYTKGVLRDIAPNTSAGVMAMAGNVGYRNGAVDTTELTGAGTSALTLYLLASNLSGTAGAFVIGSIQYVVVWSVSTGHSTWMPAVSAAVSAL